MDKEYLIIIPLLIGFVLDLMLGDPLWLPHPIRLFGKAIFFFERKLNKNGNRILKGASMSLLLVVSTWLVFFLLIRISQQFHLFYIITTSVFVFFCLANRSLIKEALKVNIVLKEVGLTAARIQLSYIVGRDTSKLNKQQIRIAILETLAENLSDGVIAPLFFYALGGVPLMMAYKMANTLDSMIGYKNNKYNHFGRFAARFDDVLNFIPARLTAVLMVIITFSWRGARFIIKYGRKHTSPNAGYPEAALAGILDSRFGGPNIYQGVKIDKPYLGDNNRLISSKDIRRAVKVNFMACVVMIMFICLVTTFVY